MYIQSMTINAFEIIDSGLQVHVRNFEHNNKLLTFYIDGSNHIKYNYNAYLYIIINAQYCDLMLKNLIYALYLKLKASKIFVIKVKPNRQ